MTHLEELIAEYYQWQGHVVKCYAQVGKRIKGGWEMELDVVTYDPHANYLLHIEPSLDANSWAVREARFTKKFEAGRKYIFPALFPWLPTSTPLSQKAILISAGPSHRTLAGAEVQTVDEFIAEVRAAVVARGVLAKAAIPEHYPLLRTIQYLECGYYRVIKPKAGDQG